MKYVNIALDNLPEQQRLAFKKKILEDQPVKDIAREMGINKKTVQNLCSLAVSRIREQLKKLKFP
jgi:RNA polymerase sigma factor (sigma-70 family)